MSTTTRLIAALDEKLPPAFERLKDYASLILSLLEAYSDDVEVVALLFDGKSIYPLCVHTRGFDLNGRRIYLLGSGRDAFFKFTQWPHDAVPATDDPAGLTLRAVMLRFAADAMLWQYGTGRGLSASWGGGFAIAHATHSGFVKMDNILIRAWAGAKETRTIWASAFSFTMKVLTYPSPFSVKTRGRSRFHRWFPATRGVSRGRWLFPNGPLTCLMSRMARGPLRRSNATSPGPVAMRASGFATAL